MSCGGRLERVILSEKARFNPIYLDFTLIFSGLSLLHLETRTYHVGVIGQR